MSGLHPKISSQLQYPNYLPPEEQDVAYERHPDWVGLTAEQIAEFSQSLRVDADLRQSRTIMATAHRFDYFLGTHVDYLARTPYEELKQGGTQLLALRKLLDELSQFSFLDKDTIDILAEAHVLSPASLRSRTAPSFIRFLQAQLGEESSHFSNAVVRLLHQEFPESLISSLRWLRGSKTALDIFRSKATERDLIADLNVLIDGKKTGRAREEPTRPLRTKKYIIRKFLEQRKLPPEKMMAETLAFMDFISLYPVVQSKAGFAEFRKSGGFTVLEQMYQEYEAFVAAGQEIGDVAQARKFFRAGGTLLREPALSEVIALHGLCYDVRVYVCQRGSQTGEFGYKNFFRMIYLATGQLKLSFLSVLLEAKPHSTTDIVYRILNTLYDKLQAGKLSQSLFRRIGLALLLGHHESNKNFMQAISRQNNITEANISVGAALIESEFSHGWLFDAVFNYSTDPGRDLTLAEAALATVSGWPLLNVAAPDPISPVQLLGLCLVISRSRQGLDPQTLLDFKELESCLQPQDSIMGEISSFFDFVRAHPRRDTGIFFDGFRKLDSVGDRSALKTMTTFYKSYRNFVDSGHDPARLARTLDYLMSPVAVLPQELNIYETMVLKKNACDALMDRGWHHRSPGMDRVESIIFCLAFFSPSPLGPGRLVDNLLGVYDDEAQPSAGYYGIMKVAYERLRAGELSITVFRRLGLALALDRQPLNEALHQAITTLQRHLIPITESAITAGVTLIEQGNRVDCWLFEALMSRSKHVEQDLALMEQALVAYRARPVLKDVDPVKLSLPEQMALYSYVVSQTGQESSLKAPLSFELFRICLSLELMKFKGNLALWKLKEHILKPWVLEHQGGLGLRKKTPSYEGLELVYRKHESDRSFIPQELLLAVYDKIFSASPATTTAFLSNVGEAESADAMKAAVELLQADLDLQGVEFQQYQHTPNRLGRLNALDGRIAELVHGSAVDMSLDLFELVAIRRALRTSFLSIESIKKVLTSAKIAPQDPRTGRHRPRSFEVTLEESLHARVHKGIVSDYVEPLLQIADLSRLADWLGQLIKNYRAEGLKLIREDILRFFGWDGQEALDLANKADQVNPNNALSLLDAILTALGRHRGNAKGMKSIIPLLIAKTWHRSAVGHLKPAIETFAPKATAEVLIDAIGALHEFYVDHLQDTVRETVGDDKHMGGFLTKAGQRLAKQLEQVQTRALGKVDLTLVPSRKNLDAFFGYVAQDCLAHETYARAALSDGCFIPCRIIVENQWMGMVFTLTVWEGKQKLLLVPGIEPQTELNMDVDEFLNGVEQALLANAKENGYAMVLIPGRGDAQSSRTATVQPKIRARYTKGHRTRQAHGFPLDSAGDYYAEHRDFKIIHDLRGVKHAGVPASNLSRWIQAKVLPQARLALAQRPQGTKAMVIKPLRALPANLLRSSILGRGL